MTTVDTVVIGAGHAGLAVSRLLSAAGRDHVVLDRGRVGERWRTERWDSLHLLTPSWMTRLPGWSYEGPDPDGYLSAGAFVDHLEAYAASFGAPVEGGTTVEQVRVSGRGGGRYAVATDRGTWQTDNVVVATGPHGIPARPGRSGARRRVHLQRVPQPRPAARRRRARRRGLVVRRPDRRRAQPRRPQGRPRRRSPHPDAAPLPRAWTSSGGWRPPAGWPATSTTCATPSPPGRSPRSS